MIGIKERADPGQCNNEPAGIFAVEEKVSDGSAENEEKQTA